MMTKPVGVEELRDSVLGYVKMAFGHRPIAWDVAAEACAEVASAIKDGGLDSVQDRVRGDSLRATLKALPIDVRADVLASMFQVIASEFAAMVLEHVKPRRSVKHSVDNVSRQTVSTKPRAKKPRGARQRGAQLKRSTAQARRRTR